METHNGHPLGWPLYIMEVVRWTPIVNESQINPDVLEKLKEQIAIDVLEELKTAIEVVLDKRMKRR